MDNSSLPLAILLLGVAAVTGFMAFRPWPAPGDTAVKPGAYFIEILQGKPPAASTPPDRATDINVIKGGLVTILTLWAIGKFSGALSGLGGGAGSSGGDESIESEAEGELGSAEDALGDLGKEVGPYGEDIVP